MDTPFSKIFKDRRIKFDLNSQLWVTVQRKVIDQNGNVHITNERYRVKENELNLGSIQKPKNEKIISYEWVDTSPKATKWFKGTEDL